MNAVDKNKWPALTHAIWYRNADIVAVLTKRGADCNATFFAPSSEFKDHSHLQCFRVTSILMRAAFHCASPIVEALLEANADPNATYHNCNALSVCTTVPSARLLIAAGSDPPENFVRRPRRSCHCISNLNGAINLLSIQGGGYSEPKMWWQNKKRKIVLTPTFVERKIFKTKLMVKNTATLDKAVFFLN